MICGVSRDGRRHRSYPSSTSGAAASSARAALKLLARMNFCEWSKHAQIAAAALVYLQGVAVPIWNYEEGKRPGSVNSVLATRNAEVSDLHVYVSIGSVAAYTLFIVVATPSSSQRRNVGPEIGSEVTVDGKSKKIKTWRDRQNSPGPSLLMRTLFNLAVGIALIVLQPPCSRAARPRSWAWCPWAPFSRWRSPRATPRSRTRCRSSACSPGPGAAPRRARTTTPRPSA